MCCRDTFNLFPSSSLEVFDFWANIKLLLSFACDKLFLGTTDTINQEGITYYKNLIKDLKANGIEPFVTLYHWDLPEILEKQGGWIANFIIDTFVDYARLCFEEFGDDVKYWLTFYDPKQICLNGYGTGSMAPAVTESAILDYKCSFLLLKAHARVWHMYDEEFRSEQNGTIDALLFSVNYLNI